MHMLLLCNKYFILLYDTSIKVIFIIKIHFSSKHLKIFKRNKV